MQRQIKILVLVLVLVMVAAACQDEQPTQYLMEVTREVTVVVVVTATPEAQQQAVVASDTPADVTAEPIASATAILMQDGTATPATTEVPTTPDPFPTPVQESIIVAEQTFENGRMFWLQPIQMIWVMVYDSEQDTTHGEWLELNDTWQEGMPELDPDIEPPEGLLQPERGFGKLWRENPAVREVLGWALEAESGHVTDYGYYFGGSVNADNEYVPGPGRHTLRSRFGETFVIDEATRTWWVLKEGEEVF